MSALEACECTGVSSCLFPTLWVVKKEGSISRQNLVRLQSSPAFPEVGGPSGSAVVAEDDCGIIGSGEGPGEGEVLEVLWSDAGYGQLFPRLSNQRC